MCLSTRQQLRYPSQPKLGCWGVSKRDQPHPARANHFGASLLPAPTSRTCQLQLRQCTPPPHLQTDTRHTSALSARIATSGFTLVASYARLRTDWNQRLRAFRYDARPTRQPRSPPRSSTCNASVSDNLIPSRVAQTTGRRRFPFTSRNERGAYEQRVSSANLTCRSRLARGCASRQNGRSGTVVAGLPGLSTYAVHGTVEARYTCRSISIAIGISRHQT